MPELTLEEVLSEIRSLAEQGLVEVQRDVQTDQVRVALTEAGWQALKDAGRA